MLDLLFKRRFTDCDGATRREFLKVGGLGIGSLSLGGLLRARAAAAAEGKAVKDTAVVWLWLGGGPTHIETFDPKLTAPSEVRSITGEVATPLPGVTIGGTFPEMAKCVDRMALVRSFAHSNSGHGGGTHWVMTGYNNRNSDNGGLPTRPSIGSIVARVRGANNLATGMPTYVRQGGIGADGPAFLGTAYAPFDPGGQARKNMSLAVGGERLDDRRVLLAGLDRMRRDVDRTGVMAGLDHFDQQAFNLVLGSAPRAFDLKDEDPKIVESYGKGLGEQMLRARRLCEAGCGFVTIQYGGWDMHGGIEKAMKNRSPDLDRAVATFVEDLRQKSLDQKILLVISGEFGRTPKINKSGGRDHWAPLSTLALAGGGLRMGQVVGDSTAKLDVPRTRPIHPQDLMATVFHVLGIDQKTQITNQAGRPVYLIEEGRPIPELI